MRGVRRGMNRLLAAVTLLVITHEPPPAETLQVIRVGRLRDAPVWDPSEGPISGLVSTTCPLLADVQRLWSRVPTPLDEARALAALSETEFVTAAFAPVKGFVASASTFVSLPRDESRRKCASTVASARVLKRALFALPREGKSVVYDERRRRGGAALDGDVKSAVLARRNETAWVQIVR